MTRLEDLQRLNSVVDICERATRIISDELDERGAVSVERLRRIMPAGVEIELNHRDGYDVTAPAPAGWVEICELYAMDQPAGIVDDMDYTAEYRQLLRRVEEIEEELSWTE